VKTSASISLKLVIVVTLCLAFSVGGLGLIALDFFKSESLSQARRDTNFAVQLIGQDLSRSQAQKMSSLFHILETNDASQIKNLSTILNSQDALLSFGVYKPIGGELYSEVYFSRCWTLTRDS
jgi:hypothetical protein